MKISLNWLKDFIATDWNAEKVGELLTDLGLEVEGIEHFESVTGNLEGVVVGRVLSCEKHPDADRLQLTTVDIGQEKPVQIVCGAPNVDSNMNVPVATVGTTLYGQDKKPFPIKKGKIRGKESFGMICAEDELSLGDDHDGIMILEEDLKPGTPLNEVFEVTEDKIFDIGLTPNRADAMSHYGVARDLKAGLLQQKINIPMDTPSMSNFQVENRSRRIAIEVDDYDLTPRYCGLTMSGFEIKESPVWLQNRLKAIGLKPKNTIVDATNYVMHEIGQPLHAFDADKIADDKIKVKRLKKGTEFTTLDGEKRKLHAEDLMICDAKKPLCIAGVMGGKDSGVSENTKAIFLESAYFNSVSVRKTAKRHSLKTDASYRFERGVDPHITEFALKRVALLIQEIAGVFVTSDLDDVYPRKIEDFQVFLTFERINNLIGQEIDPSTIKSILASLEIKVNNVTESGLGLTIPTYRVDVRREIDVIEEILRVYGYNNIETSEKFNASIANSDRFEDYKIQNLIAQQLIGQGFYEMMANSLTSPEFSEKLGVLKDGDGDNVSMLNPLSQDLSVMRQSLVFSSLEAAAYNLNRQQQDLKFFEFGKTYSHTDKKFEEQKHLSLLVTGKRQSERWNSLKQDGDFFYFKGLIDGVLSRLGFDSIDYAPVQNEFFSEGNQVSSEKNVLVEFGILKKKLTRHFEIEQEVLFADFNWDIVLEKLKKSTKFLHDIPKFPSVRRDFALLLDEGINFSQIHEIANNTEKELLNEVELFDVYTGGNLPDAKKSYAVSFTFQDENKTLTDKRVDKIMKKLQTQFEKQLGASLR